MYQSELAVMLLSKWQQRDNKLYNGITGARETFLQDGDLPYKFPAKPGLPTTGYESLAAAAVHYDGSVRVMLPPMVGQIRGDWRVLKQHTRILPWDNYIWQADGTQERCDDFGRTNPALEYLQGDWTGVAATGEVGPGAGTTVAIESPLQQLVILDFTAALRSGGQEKQTFRIGQGGFLARFNTPVSSSHDVSIPGGGGFINCESDNFTPAQSYDLSVVTRDRILHHELSNGMHTSFGTGDENYPSPYAPFMTPLNAPIAIFGVPTALQYSAKGHAGMVLEVMAPWRGASATWS